MPINKTNTYTIGVKKIMRIRIRIYSVLKNHPNTNTIWLKNICQIRRIRISLFGLNYSNTIWIPNYSLTSGSLQEKENKDSETFDCLIGWLAKGAFVIQVPSSKRKQRFKKEFPSIDFYLLFTLSGKISTITFKKELIFIETSYATYWQRRLKEPWEKDW